MRRTPWIVLCLLAGGAIVAAVADAGRGSPPPEAMLAFAAPHAAEAAIRAWRARESGDVPHDADDRSRG